ncbi:MAG: methytransferase partner Trm112 [Chloroflexi bacterium]|nr:methytransferase partner Trm112 [Chloroflexota bacterium]
MRRDLMDILVCPVCKEPLDLAVEREEDGEVLTGTLTSPGCGATYPIEDGIPDLLPGPVSGPASS